MPVWKIVTRKKKHGKTMGCRSWAGNREGNEECEETETRNDAGGQSRKDSARLDKDVLVDCLAVDTSGPERVSSHAAVTPSEAPKARIKERAANGYGLFCNKRLKDHCFSDSARGRCGIDNASSCRHGGLGICGQGAWLGM